MNIDLKEIASVPAITAICFLIGAVFKGWDLFEDKKIPPAMGIAGAALGVLALYIAPAIMPANDIISAIAIGAVSGFAATGIHQIYKQAKKLEG